MQFGRGIVFVSEGKAFNRGTKKHPAFIYINRPCHMAIKKGGVS
jgi:hypothetical protein